MNVARILKDKGRNVVTAPPDTKISEIIRTLAANRIGALVVCDDNKHVVGIVSERDVVRILALHGHAVLNAAVSQHMTREVVTCTERDTVGWLKEEMTMHRFRHVPVVEGGKLIGIVSIGDVVKLCLATVELEAASMREYIATG
jgi:CBS domain-containing protein